MGFMKFRKKNNAELDNSLDIPPPPPIESGGYDKRDGLRPLFSQQNSDGLEPFPPLSMEPMTGKKQDMPKDILPLPKEPPKMSFAQPRQEQMPSFDIPPITAGSSDDRRQESLFPRSEPARKPAPVPKRYIPPAMPKLKSFDEILGQSSQDTHDASQYNSDQGDVFPSRQGRQVFIEVGKYKQLLKELNTIRKSLKQTNDEVSELVADIGEEEKLFSSLHTNLSDVEKKLTELEDSLFSQ